MRLFQALAYKRAGLLLTLLTVPGVAFAQGTGAIRGAVTTLGPDGVPVYLPGVQIALRCEKAADNARTTVTDETGRFSLPGLVPDKCSVTATAEGFRSETKPVVVTEKSPVELSFKLSLTTVEEKVTVSGAAPLVDVTQTSPQETIKSTTLEHAPLANERFTDTIPLLPGVVRGPDGLLNVKGARASQSGLLVNSTNVTDPVTGEYGINLPIDVIQSVQVLANPYDAQYGKFTGAITTVQTRSGGDNFKVQFQNFIPRTRKRAGSIVGIEAATPRLTFSGPVKKGKVYYLQSLEYRFIRTRVPGLRHLDPILRSDTNLESFDSHTQFDLELGATNHLVVSFSLFPQKLGFANLNTFNPQEVTPNFRQRGFLIGIAGRKVFANQSLLESFFGVKKFDVDVFPASSSSSVMILRPEENAGSYFNRQDRDSRRYEWQEVYHFRPFQAWGQHLAEIGINVSHSSFEGLHASNSVQVQRSNGSLAQLIEFVGPTPVERAITETTFFVQDKWTLHPRLTLDFGLRYDRDTLGNNNNFAPRFGFSVALTSDNRTVLRGGVGRFFDKIPLNVVAFEQLQSRRTTRFAADGITPLGPPLLFRNVIQGGHLDNPRSVAWNAELDREVAPNLVVRLSYQQRQSRRDFVLDPIETPQPILLLRSAGRSLYREYQVTARYQFQEKSQWVVSYVHTRATGDLNDFNQFFGNFENPIIRPNERSLLPFDAPNRFLTWADIQLPHDVVVSPVFEVHDGFPFSLVDANHDFVGPRNRAGRFPTFAALDLQVTKGLKIPVFGRKLKSRVGLKIFNLTDHFNPRDIQNNIDSSPVSFRQECSQFGQLCSSVGRTFRGKFILEF
ncbi:MAG: TonB-dependent receptor [Acidobacteria bacterium]|nr:TonB-dependent receptor [Acidobacteriota bacterium]